MIAALVLAAGQSSRTAPAHKLLATDHAGVSLIARTVDHVLASAARPVWIVVGHQAEAIRSSLLAGNSGDEMHFVHAPDYRQGLSASLRAGLAALPDAIAGVVICLGDMPFVTPGTVDRLIEAFVAGRIVVPICDGERGNPVLWDRCFISEMMQIAGDRGARDLLAQYSGLVIEVSVADRGVLRDCDTAEALRDWTTAITPGYKQATI